MSEIKTEMKTFLVDMVCKECNWGRMRPTGIAFMIDPPKYHHKCDRCSHSETYDVRYPNTEMVAV